MLKNLITWTLAIGLAIFGAFTVHRVARQWLQMWSTKPVMLTQPVEIELGRGTPLRSLSQTLAARGLVSHPMVFEIWVKTEADYSKFQAGLYRFEGAVTPSDIAQRIAQGEIYIPLVLQVAIPEGFTLQKIISRLAARGVGTEDELRTVAHDAAFLQSLNISAKSPEGYLYPLTYNFSKVPTPHEAFQMMVDAFWQALPENYEANVNAMGLSLYEAVTFASLIELETRMPEEKPYVSEVIWKRLKNKIALAIDATLIYGIPDYSGNLTQKHLEDASNPYNTRLRRGLPPTPIGSPSRDSLEAVLHPSNEGYLYYVLDLSDGSHHHFSKSLTEHNQYVRELIKEGREKRRSEAAAGSGGSP